MLMVSYLPIALPLLYRVPCVYILVYIHVFRVFYVRLLLMFCSLLIFGYEDVLKQVGYYSKSKTYLYYTLA